MKRLVIHIGPPKCASSTIQGYLSKNPVLPLDGLNAGTLRYVAVTAGGDIIHGDAAMRSELLGNPYGFVFSDPSTITDPAMFSAFLSKIVLISDPEDIIVISQEFWGHQNFLTAETQNIINSAPVPVDIFMMTRPPVDWVSSAWWQGPSWSGGVDDKKSMNYFKRANFFKLMNKWKSIKRVEKVGVRDISQGPVESFLDFVGASQSAPPPVQKLNVATDFDLLRHLMRNREHYGRTAKNPTVEFRLNGWITGARKPLPGIVSRPLAYDMINRHLRDHSRLVELLQKDARLPLPPQVARRYVDPTAYDHLPESVDFSADFDADYSDDFMRGIVDALLAMGRHRDDMARLDVAISQFDPLRYLELNPDVRDSGMNPFEHFVRHGYKENRPVS